MNARLFRTVVWGLAFLFPLGGTAATAGDLLTLTGVVEMTDDGPTLHAKGKVFLLDGEGMESLAGKNARVTGMLETSEDGDGVLVVEFAEKAN
ncbi:MAG: hypothetical protein V1816_24360 [Pseudomonadota bacterium]